MKKKLSLKKKTVSLIDSQQAAQIKGGTDTLPPESELCGPISHGLICLTTEIFNCFPITHECGNTYDEPCNGGGGGGDTVQGCNTVYQHTCQCG